MTQSVAKREAQCDAQHESQKAAVEAAASTRRLAGRSVMAHPILRRAQERSIMAHTIMAHTGRSIMAHTGARTHAAERPPMITRTQKHARTHARVRARAHTHTHTRPQRNDDLEPVRVHY